MLNSRKYVLYQYEYIGTLWHYLLFLSLVPAELACQEKYVEHEDSDFGRSPLRHRNLITLHQNLCQTTTTLQPPILTAHTTQPHSTQTAASFVRSSFFASGLSNLLSALCRVLRFSNTHRVLAHLLRVGAEQHPKLCRLFIPYPITPPI